MDVSRINPKIYRFPYGYDNFKRELEDGIQAANEIDAWPWLKNYRPSDYENIDKFDSKLKYAHHHSGGSHAFMMRLLEYIANHGFDEFVLFMNTYRPLTDKEAKYEAIAEEVRAEIRAEEANANARPPTPVPPPVSQIIDQANTGGSVEVLTSAPIVELPEKVTREQMLAETNDNMSLNDQLKSIAKFKDVPMTYAEMRSRYG